ncbi:hypothetical protein WAI453_000037 [Rhynchosporium graminicola]|uniref:Related to C4-dicarboxylate transport protein n=1 Tax=Rhynchosporium graminicola TaxID=2792576 RepID=A0A1E1K1P3_9HELO|nr:related to C4-dicarboxylate transport protein [Rhynchosporium commune]
MSYQAGPTSVDDLVNYKKAILRDDRRDTRIRGSIEATLEFFKSKQSDAPPLPAGRPAYPTDSSGLNNTMSYPQISRPTMAPQYNDYNDMEKRPSNFNDFKSEKMDIEAKPAVHHDDHHGISAGPHTLKERLKHFTFSWYAFTMATGGTALTLSVVPNRFSGLTGLGTFMFLLNIFFFICVTSAMITRFIIYPEIFISCFTNFHEGVFSATFWLTCATMITNTVAYGVPKSGPWLIEALRIAFWIYTVCATLHAIIYYQIIFVNQQLKITNVLPGWVLPMFPAMLVGTLAGAIAKTQPPQHAYPMLIAGLSYQGFGFFMALFMYPLYFGRLLTSGIPAYLSRPAMFIAVGPPAFTALALINMAQDVQVTKIFDGYTKLQGVANQALIPDLFSIMALVMAIFLWVLAFWFFVMAFIAMIDGLPHNDFHLNWYAKVFPNVGFTIATIKIGERIDSPAVQLVGTAMAAVLFFSWCLVFFCHIKAFLGHMICWPGRDEDAH